MQPRGWTGLAAAAAAAALSAASLLLLLLFMSRAPPPARAGGGARPPAHEYMLELFARTARGPAAGKPREPPPADVVRALAPLWAGSGRPSARDLLLRRPGSEHLLKFRLPPPRPGEALQAAELRFWAGSDPPGAAVWRQAASGRRRALGTARPAPAGWLVLDLTAAVTGAGAGEDRTLNLGLRAERGMHLALEPHRRPLLLLLSSAGPPERAAAGSEPDPVARAREAARPRREADPEEYEEQTNAVWGGGGGAGRARRRGACRRRPLYVDFAEINYDSWIVAPAGYEAYQCAGRCGFPVAAHLSPTKHAVMQALLHSVSPGRASRACCVPARLDPISVLYVDERGVLTYRFSYHDMVVAECGCR